MNLIHAFVVLTTLAFGSSNGFDDMRKKMVREQIVRRGISDTAVIRAMLKVERHKFVNQQHEYLAYSDRPLPIDMRQTISQPYIVAYMTETLNIKPTDRVLEIGTGSGYQAAVLAEICDSVFTIEIFPELAQRAQRVVAELGYDNIYIKQGDGCKGWKEKAPFDAIIVTCSPTDIPPDLKEQLAEGGRMIIPVGERFSQYLILLTKKDGKLKKSKKLAVRFVPMIDDEGKSY